MLFLILRALLVIFIAAFVPSQVASAAFQKAQPRKKTAAEEHYRQWLERDEDYQKCPENKKKHGNVGTAAVLYIAMNRAPRASPHIS